MKHVPIISHAQFSRKTLSQIDLSSHEVKNAVASAKEVLFDMAKEHDLIFYREDAPRLFDVLREAI